MSLRNQPYLPLYVDDFLSDENLLLCSAAATGVYIKIMCLMHKSREYGKISLNPRFKTSSNFIKNIATQLTKQLPFDFKVVVSALNELIESDVISVENDVIFQKRMVKDYQISEARARAGRIGGIETQHGFAKAKYKANIKANYVNGIENVNTSRGTKIEKEIGGYFLLEEKLVVFGDESRRELTDKELDQINQGKLKPWHITK